MNTVTLKAKTEKGEHLQAHFCPERGMNLMSYQLDNIEVIDQSTKEAFMKRYAGLGALIGPHFHRRPTHLVPHLNNPSLFPHIANMDENADPFSHGIARYAPWTYEATETTIKGILTGKDEWHGVPLADIEGQNFKITFKAELTPNGLNLNLSCVSDIDSLVGIHYYYHLPEGKGTILSQVKDHYIFENKKHKIPSGWLVDGSHNMSYPLNQDTDFTFHHYPDPLEGDITLDTSTHKVITKSKSPSEENSWQLWHPQGASFACVEPISSQDPRHPNLTVSSIDITISIMKKK